MNDQRPERRTRHRHCRLTRSNGDDLPPSLNGALPRFVAYMRRIGTFDLAVVAAISDMPFGVAVSASEKAVNNRQHLAMSRVMEA
jgi:hypothetical protein